MVMEKIKIKEEIRLLSKIRCNLVYSSDIHKYYITQKSGLGVIRCRKCLIYTRDFYQSRRNECKKCSNDRHYSYTENNREKHNNYLYKWQNENKEKVRKWSNDWAARKYRKDPLFRMGHQIRTSMRHYLFKSKNLGYQIPHVGCNGSFLRGYLERMFDAGMDWTNYGASHGKWTIDHIIPTSSAKNREELHKLCHYTNLQPLWHIENVKKGSTVASPE